MHSRNVPAMDTKTNPQMWELTNAQWSVYYWLLAHSKRNPNSRESHYFIYRNAFTLPQVRKGTGIKSDKTIRTALEKLTKVGALYEDTTTGAYIIQPPYLHVAMNTSILLGLLAFNKYIDAGMTITTFAILARLHKFSERGSEVTFNKAELATLLGFARQNVDRAGVVLILYLLKGLELVKFRTTPYTNRLGAQCVRYVLEDANPASTSMDYLFSEDEAVDMGRVDELWAAAAEQANQEITD